MWICRITGQSRNIHHRYLCDSLIYQGKQRFDGDRLRQQREIIGKWPENQEQEKVSLLLKMIPVQQIATQCRNIKTMTELRNLLPIVPDMNEKAQLAQFEIDIEVLLPHLQYVCNQPHLRLEVEEENMLIFRAKKWSNKAIPNLLSHPEHWERRTLTGVEPSHLLSKVMVDQWDLYENKIVVRLVELLIRYLSRRIHEIQTIKDLSNFENANATSYWRRTKRICSLWGKVWSTDNNQVDATLHKLIMLRNRILGLKLSPLCKKVSNRQINFNQLKETNILSNDPHYRKIVILWKRLFESDPELKHQSENEQIQSRISEGEAWQEFVYLLVIRGLYNIGWSCSYPNTALSSDTQFSKEGWEPVSIKRDQYGIIRLKCQNTTFILAPMCANLEGIQYTDCQYTHLQEQILFVHPGSAISETRQGTGWHVPNNVAFINVSPWCLDSEEKISRVLHVWVAKFAFPKLPLFKQYTNLPLSSASWYTYNNSVFTVIKYPTEEEKQRLKNKLCNNKQNGKNTSNKKIISNCDAERLLTWIDSPELVKTKLMSSCPLCCSTNIRHDYTNNLDWRRICNDCNTKWGCKKCNICQHTYPLLSVYGDNIEQQYDATSIPDEVFGSELWGFPKSIDKKYINDYFCSFCGK